MCWVAAVAIGTVVAESLLGSFPVALFSFPLNILTLALWATLITLIYRRGKESAFARFMLSNKALWLSFLLIAGVGITLGLERKPSSDSWPVVVAILFVLSHLTFVTLRGWRNARGIRWRFTIIHLGLLVALGSGFWGAPDREQLRIAVDVRPNDEAYTITGEPRILDYTLSLNDHTIELSENGVPKHYEAEVAIDGTDSHRATIRVNHPYALSWSEKLYLISFGQSTSGQTYCILEIVREPWQWLTMTGIVMLIVGAVMMFLGGPRRQIKGANVLNNKRV